MTTSVTTAGLFTREKTVCPVAQVPDGAHNTHCAWLKVWWHAVDEE
jgi:hypothetical protein